jgi:hypothetical protein
MCDANGLFDSQVYIQLQSPQAATALKHQIDNLFKDQAHAKKPTAIFNPPQHNPFKTLPKDVPARDKGRSDRGSSGGYGNQTGGFNNNSRGSYNRGNYNNRGANMGYQNNRNFSNPAAGNMGGGMGYGGQAAMSNFPGNAMGAGMNNFGGGFNRGAMMGNNMRGGMGNRGGRGGMGLNNMGGGMGMNMPMANNMMGMGAGGMMGMGGNMGMMGFSNPQAFNPAFFGQQQQPGGNDWGNNPHGAKRPRPE